MNTITAILAALSLSIGALASKAVAADPDGLDQRQQQLKQQQQGQTDKPRSVLVKKDENGELFIYTSDKILRKASAENEAQLDSLEFERVSDFKEIDQVRLKAALAKIDRKIVKIGITELDQDSPRQSWYWWWWGGWNTWWGWNWGWNWTWQPYWFWWNSGCSFYWFRW